MNSLTANLNRPQESRICGIRARRRAPGGAQPYAARVVRLGRQAGRPRLTRLYADERERQVTLTVSEVDLNSAGPETIFRRPIETIDEPPTSRKIIRRSWHQPTDGKMSGRYVRLSI